MPYNRSEFISKVEQELGNSLTGSQKARVDDIAAETGNPRNAAYIFQRENENRRMLRRWIVTVLLAIGLAVIFAVSRST